MTATTAEIATLLQYPALSLVSAWLGYLAAVYNRNDQRKRSSLNEVAEAIEREAARWATVGCRLSEQGVWIDEKFYFDARAKEWVRGSVKRLASDIAYVQRNHPAVWNTMRRHWDFYSSASDIFLQSYADSLKKEDFISALYHMAEAALADEVTYNPSRILPA